MLASARLTTDGLALLLGIQQLGPTRQRNHKPSPHPDGSDTRSQRVLSKLAPTTSTACGLTSAGQAWCWGLGTSGQLGNAASSDSSTPVAVNQGSATYKAISVGAIHTCALTLSGQAQCWGRGTNGRLGNNATGNTSSPVDVQQSSTVFTSISAGSSHTCAIDNTSKAWCWGNNANGTLGDSSVISKSVPTGVQQGALNFTSIVAASNHTCATTTSTAYCWGYNPDGELGDGTTAQSTTPVAVSGGLSFSSISSSSSGSHVCGVQTSSQRIYCWGERMSGAYGDNAEQLSRSVPVAPAAGLTTAGLVLGVNTTCALTSGQAKCWGGSSFGQIGDNTSIDRIKPTVVQQGATSFTALSAGGNFNCGLAATSQKAFCWGQNSSGQLGDTTTGTRLVPTAVSQGATTFTQLATGRATACGLTSGGQTYCWGSSSNGQVGDNNTTNRTAPVTVSQGGAVYSAIVGGSSHMCGLSSGQAWCWGLNSSGQLGNNSTTDQSSPVAVQQGGATYVSLTAGGKSTCGLTSGGQAYCWGSNLYGQLGDSSTVDKLVPVAVQQGGVLYSAIVQGQNHTCASGTNGQTYCWGDNAWGQVGDNTLTQRAVPTAISNSTNFASLKSSSGSNTTCGVAVGTTLCWGLNTFNQTGDWTNDNALSPVQAWFYVSASDSVVSASIDPSLTFGVYCPQRLVQWCCPDSWGKCDIDGRFARASDSGNKRRRSTRPIYSHKRRKRLYGYSPISEQLDFGSRNNKPCFRYQRRARTIPCAWHSGIWLHNKRCTSRLWRCRSVHESERTMGRTISLAGRH